MAITGGVIGFVLEWLVGLLSGLFGSLWAWLSALVGGLFGSLWGWIVALLGGVIGVIWGWVLFLLIFLAAAVLNLAGVGDVHGYLDRNMGGDDASESDPVDTIRDVSHEEVTDGSGRFSPDALERVTGMTPAEFVHLFVRANGGRVKQKTLNTCLPWSKATVSRYLDTLEDDDVVERVTIGREKIVCLPEAVPGQEAAAEATP